MARTRTHDFNHVQSLLVSAWMESGNKGGAKMEKLQFRCFVTAECKSNTSSSSQGRHTETNIHPHTPEVSLESPIHPQGLWEQPWGRNLVEKDSDRDPFWWKVTALTTATGCFFKKQINNFHNKICLESCPSFEDPRQRHHKLKQRF